MSPQPHPHPLRSNPVLLTEMSDTKRLNIMVSLTQDVATGLRRTPAIQRINTFVSKTPRRQPELRRSNTVSREAGLPAVESGKGSCELIRQSAVRRQDLSATGTLAGMTLEESSREVSSSRPFSFTRGTEMLDLKKIQVIPMTTIPEYMQRPRKVGFEDEQVPEPGKFRTHASMLVKGTSIPQPETSHLPLAKNVDPSTELILLNNRLRAVSKQLDSIHHTYRHESLSSAMVYKIKAQVARFEKVPRRLNALGISSFEIAGSATASQDISNRIEQWRNIIQVMLNIISSILKEHTGQVRDGGSIAALTKSVEDAEQFVASFDLDSK